MNRIAEDLDATLSRLDPLRANELVAVVRRAIEHAERSAQTEKPDWPDGYFEQTAGSFANEPLERSPQGEPTARDVW